MNVVAVCTTVHSMLRAVILMAASVVAVIPDMLEMAQLAMVRKEKYNS